MCTIWEMAETIRAEEQRERQNNATHHDAPVSKPIAAERATVKDAGVILRATFVALLAGGALGGCQRAPDMAKVDADVQKAQADGEKKVADAQAKLDKVIAENRKDLVDAQVDARRDAQTATANPAPATPVANPPADKVARTEGDAMQKSADAQYDLDKARADASYDVATARCEAQTGDAEKACKETAKAQRDTVVARAKSRNDVAHQRAGDIKG